jgi:hypothetical protein
MPCVETCNSSIAARRTRTDSLWLALRQRAALDHLSPWTFRPSALHRDAPVSRSPLPAFNVRGTDAKLEGRPPARSAATVVGDCRDVKEVPGVLPSSALQSGRRRIQRCYRPACPLSGPRLPPLCSRSTVRNPTVPSAAQMRPLLILIISRPALPSSEVRKNPDRKERKSRNADRASSRFTAW